MQKHYDVMMLARAGLRKNPRYGHEKYICMCVDRVDEHPEERDQISIGLDNLFHDRSIFCCRKPGIRGVGSEYRFRRYVAYIWAKQLLTWNPKEEPFPCKLMSILPTGT